MLVKDCKTLGADWLLQIDSDHSFQPNLLRIIMRTANKDTRPIIAGLYSNVGNMDQGDGKFDVVDCIYGEAENGQYRVATTPVNMQPFKVDAAGTGIFLTHLSVFDKIEYPWFWLALFQNPDGSEQLMNEDIAFCRAARAKGYDIWCDPLASATHWKTLPLIPSTARVFMNHAKDAFKSMSGNYENINPEIEGFMSEGELYWLYGQAKRFNSVAEIGCWKGRSTYALLKGCSGNVYAIDHFLGSVNERETNHHEATETDIYAQFRENVGMFPNLKVFKCSSMEAVSQFPSKMVEMVFIDAEHTREALTEDLEGWYPICSQLLCGHDINMPEVKEAVETFTQKYGLTYNTGAGSIWYINLN
jgi:predicted O-methyltransferase YrrM